jgi:hypothetical protein
MVGVRASGGLAVVSQQSRSTTWSLTRRLKHSVAGWASTWSVRQNMSDKRRDAILEALCARCSMASWLRVLLLAVEMKKRPDRGGFSEALADRAAG